MIYQTKLILKHGNFMLYSLIIQVFKYRTEYWFYCEKGVK